MAWITGSIRSLDRQTQLLLVALIPATTVTALALVFFQELDLDSVVPLVSGGRWDRLLAVGVLVALNLVVALPLLARRELRARVARFSCVVIALFAVVTILRLGLAYLPSAVALGIAGFGQEPIGDRVARG